MHILLQNVIKYISPSVWDYFHVVMYIHFLRKTEAPPTVCRLLCEVWKVTGGPVLSPFQPGTVACRRLLLRGPRSGRLGTDVPTRGVRRPLQSRWRQCFGKKDESEPTPWSRRKRVCRQSATWRGHHRERGCTLASLAVVRGPRCCQSHRLIRRTQWVIRERHVTQCLAHGSVRETRADSKHGRWGGGGTWGRGS